MLLLKDSLFSAEDRVHRIHKKLEVCEAGVGARLSIRVEWLPRQGLVERGSSHRIERRGTSMGKCKQAVLVERNSAPITGQRLIG